MEDKLVKYLTYVPISIQVQGELFPYGGQTNGEALARCWDTIPDGAA